jgi:hypothetical protein
VAILIGLGSFNFVNFVILKGVIWLVLGSAIEIPPLVSPASLVRFLLFIPRFRRRCSPFCI